MSARFHLAIDARDLASDPRGIGVYARALVSRYIRRDDLHVTLLVHGILPWRSAAALRAALDLERGTRLHVANRIPRDADVVWHPWNGTFFTGGMPAVATIHDLVPFTLPVADAERRAHQQAPFVRTAATARTIVCDSRYTASDVERFLSVQSERLRVVPLGVDPVFAPGDDSALPPALRGRRYLLHVGAHDAHKNVATLVAAYRRACDPADVALVMTRRGPDAPEALAFEHADRTTLVALYRAATLVAVPSVYEGFGLPVLEAMACGAPVLASRAASLPEVGGDAVAYVDAPRDVDAWAHALRALIADAGARSSLAARGLARARDFSWDRCANETLAIIRAAA